MLNTAHYQRNTNETINKMKRQLKELEKIFVNNVTGKGLISSYVTQ